MKFTQLLSYSARLFLCLIVFSFVGCEEEFESLDNSSLDAKNPPLQTIITNLYELESNTKLMSALSKISNKDVSTARNEMVEGLLIDSTYVKQIETEEFIFYTMFVYPSEYEETSINFTNLLAKEGKNEEGIDFFLLEYSPNATIENQDIDGSFILDGGEVNLVSIGSSSNNSTSSIFTTACTLSITVCINTKDGNGTGPAHIPGPKCKDTSKIFTYTANFCNETAIPQDPEDDLDLSLREDIRGTGATSSSFTNISEVIPDLATEPINLYVEAHFVRNLSNELQDWWNNPFASVEQTKQKDAIEAFLLEHLDSSQPNGFEPEAEAFAQEVIAAIANEEVLVEGPDFPIYDLEEYLDVFDTSPTSQASITIYVDQPNPDLPNLPVAPSSGVGHSFISITQGNNTVNYGFYPAEDCGFGWPNPSDGQMGNDENHVFDVSVSVDIDGSTLQTLITHSLSFANTDYILEDMNCTDFALSIANIIGLNISDTDISGSFVIGNGSTPGKFGEFLRNMNLPQGVIRNTDGGTAPSNSVE